MTRRPWRPLLGRGRLRTAVVAGDSMLPTLRAGDCVVVRVGAQVAPGDVVVAIHPSQPGLLVVKRAVWYEDAGWWLVSDNPGAPGATDSFGFGAVPRSKLVGKVWFRYYPWRRRPRGRPGAGSERLGQS